MLLPIPSTDLIIRGISCFTLIMTLFRLFQRLQHEIEEIQSSFRVGSVIFLTDPLRLALVTETQNWKQTYAKALNEKCALEMDSIMEFIDNLMKRLNRPIKDLDDVRAAMAALNEIRENEVTLFL